MNGDLDSLNSAAEPYIPDEVVSYACSSGFAPNPENAALTTCTCNDNGNDTASWTCNSTATTTTCEPGKHLSQQQLVNYTRLNEVLFWSFSFVIFQLFLADNKKLLQYHLTEEGVKLRVNMMTVYAYIKM